MKLEFCYVDVFTSERFKGNPAAVFYEADGLDGKIMQKIANELNLSETVFLQKPTDKKADYKARIFTPKKELPFAGHPTIAASYAFKDFYNISKQKITQECGAGLIEIDEKQQKFFVKQKDPEFKEIKLKKEQISELFSIKKEEISDFPFLKISTGIWWGVIMLNSSQTVSKLSPNHQKIIDLSKKEDLVGVQVFAKSNNQNSDIHVRTFAPICGVFEDPACGSGNGCIASYIAKNNILKKTNYIVSQGVEIDRESKIYAEFEKDDNVVKNIKIGGEAIKVLKGEIEI